jgi:hypothetical protein
VTQLIAVPIADGSEILIEVDGPPRLTGTVTRGARPESVVERATQTFEGGLARVVPVATAMVKQFRESTEALDSLKVKFGLKFSGDAGFFIASASTEATFDIEITWKSGARGDVRE